MSDTSIVYVAIVGRQPALAATIAANTANPVVFYPTDPKADADILSGLHLPGGVTVTTVLYPDSVAVEVAKLMGKRDPELTEKIKEYLANFRRGNEQADENFRKLPEQYYRDVERNVGGPNFAGAVIRSQYENVADMQLRYLQKYLRGMDVVVLHTSGVPVEKLQSDITAAKAQKRKVIVVDSGVTTGKIDNDLYVMELDQINRIE